MAATLFAYVGPETTIPLLSMIAAVGGVILMLGRTTFSFLFRKAGRLLGLCRPAESIDGGDSALDSTSSSQ
jgi:hypothetical protein